MRYRVLLSIAGWVAVGVTGIANTAKAQEVRVGPLGDPSRLAVRGVACAPAREVAKARGLFFASR